MARFTLPESDPENDHFVLHYNAYREAFSAHNIVEQHYFNFIISTFIIIGFVGLCVCVALEINPLWFATAFIVLLAIPTALDLASPTHLEITKEGIRFLWSNPLWYFMSPVVQWKSITRAEFKTDSQGKNDSSYFALTIDTTGDYEIANSSLTLMPLIKSHYANQVTLKLLEKGFFQAADRVQFTRSLQKLAPAESVTSELLALMVFDKVPTYTSLWLDEFGQHRQNDSLMVPDGASLANGQYQVLNRLGAGGQSIIYEAKKITPESTLDNLDRCVLKEFVLPSRGGYEINKRALENVQREYALLKSIDHPDIVKAFDLFVEGNRAYLVLERVFGANIRTLGFQSDFNKGDVLPFAIQMCDILAYLHSRVPPIVHRDFTPDNLLLTADKRLKLIDFNIAFSLESNNTKTVAGKHAYISPEQFRGKPTIQSDIYSLGATLYFLLMGKDPEPIAKSVPECDARLAEVIGKSTEPNQIMRYQDIEHVKQDLLKCRQE